MRKRLWCLALITGMVAGCGLRQPYPDRHFYAISAGATEVSAGATASAPAREVSLRVAGIRVVQPYNEIAFCYKVGKNEFKTDYYHGFAAPPARLLTPQLITRLNSSGKVKFAVGADIPVNATYTVETTVTDFYGNFTDVRNPMAVIGVRVLVISEMGGGTQIVLNKAYNASERVAGEGVEKLVAAWSAAWQNVLNEISADMGELPVPQRSN